jgi:hypothetical protein
MGEMPVADPEVVTYEGVVGTKLRVELRCDTLGLRELGVVATGMHHIVNDVVVALMREGMQEKGYEPLYGEGADDPLMVSLALQASATGSWWGEIHLRVDKRVVDFARDVSTHLTAAVLATMLTGSVGHSPQPPTLSGSQPKLPECCAGIDVGPHLGKMVDGLMKTNRRATLIVKGENSSLTIYLEPFPPGKK